MAGADSERILSIRTVLRLARESAGPGADGEQRSQALTAEVRNQKHQADQRKKRKNIGFNVLALREIIEASVAL